MYVVCGASGNIGHAITERLLAEGKKVRVIGRTMERLQPLIDKGAEPWVADLRDTDSITKAFTGATAVYAMIPPNLTTTDYRGYQNEIGESITTAIGKSDVNYVVNLSSIGANMSEGVGVVTGLHDQEERLNRLEGTNVLHLRPTFFMENHLWQVDGIKEQGMMATPQSIDTPMPQIATSDVADYAVERMTNLDFTGHVTRELLGPEDVTMTQVAETIGTTIGKKDLKYVQVSYEDTKNYMTNMGVSENVADGMIELYRAFNEGICRPTETRTTENTTTTTITDFSTAFRNIFNK